MTARERAVLRLLTMLFLPHETFDALQVFPAHADHPRRRALERLAEAGLLERAGDGYRLTLHSFDAAGMPPPRRTA